jgi:hypothetical protein
METADTLAIGIILLLIVPLLFVEYPAYKRGRYTSQFWNLELEDKLDHIADQPEYWTRMGSIWPPILALAAAGMTGFTFQLASHDDGFLVFAALGLFLLGTVAWLVGSVIQTVAVRVGALRRKETGETPDWFDVAWTGAWWAELTFVLSANVAFLTWGLLMVDTGFPATWMGWTAVIMALIALVMILFVREVFPHLGILVPIVLGVALVIH